MPKRDLTKLTKKELKELRKDARMKLCSYNVTTDLDAVIQSLYVNGYIDIMGNLSIYENIFINDCTKILDKLMRLLSSKKIERKYMRICTIAPDDPDSSNAFRCMMNQWTFDNPYLTKISIVKEYIVNEMRHNVNVYFGQDTSHPKDVDKDVSKCIIDIYNIRKAADSMLDKDGATTHTAGLLYLVRFCLSVLYEYKEEDVGYILDYDKWDDAKKFLERLELSFVKTIAETEMRKNINAKLNALIDSSINDL